MTALHLFGPAGGLDRDIHPMRVSSAWQSTSLVDCVSGQSFEQLTGKPLSLAFTAPYPDKSRLGDVAAYMPDEVRGLAPFTLSSRLPSEGEVVWLVSPVLDEESLVHRAKILGTQDGWLAYQFDELIEMRATSGAAVIDSAGDVVAVNVAGGELQGYTVGLGTPASSFYKDLQIAAGLR